LNAPNAVDFSLNGMALKNALIAKISNNTTALPYSSSSFDTWDALMLTDEDPNNSLNVLLIYNSQSEPKTNTVGNGNNSFPAVWNREHVFPKSLASPALETGNPGPGTDIHNLRAAKESVNSARGSLKFAAGSGNSGPVGSNWYPGDEWKGDVARIIMYMYLRYDGNGSSITETQCLPTVVGVGNVVANDPNMIDLFLQWNAEDPVSDIERQRNPVSEDKQNNRNPFIDNPFLATKIWGGPPAEDVWGTLGVDEIAQNTFSIYPIPANEHKIFIRSTAAIIKQVALFTMTGQQILSENNPQKNNNQIVLDNLPSGFYVLKIHSEKGITSKKVLIN
ncbi:MAG TPA: T9SS type A sorting domain-containing protein, partial [Flavobacteriia bacterium]|nr:T9SS type A sorting domain-containing protein [Flavobacteriia bacterium]